MSWKSLVCKAVLSDTTSANVGACAHWNANETGAIKGYVNQNNSTKTQPLLSGLAAALARPAAAALCRCRTARSCTGSSASLGRCSLPGLCSVKHGGPALHGCTQSISVPPPECGTFAAPIGLVPKRPHPSCPLSIAGRRQLKGWWCRHTPRDARCGRRRCRRAHAEAWRS